MNKDTENAQIESSTTDLVEDDAGKASIVEAEAAQSELLDTKTSLVTDDASKSDAAHKDLAASNAAASSLASENNTQKLPAEPDILSSKDNSAYKDDLSELKNIIEAAILISTEPLGLKKIQQLFLEDATPSLDDIRACLAELQKECEHKGIELKQIGKGFRFQSKEKYATWLRRLYNQRIPRYSRAVLETLSIIAYRQPVTRADIEEVRGVAVSSEIIKTLVSREWIIEVGKKEVPGRPSLYGTSSEFLAYFNLQGLDELPALPDVRELSQIAKDNQIELPDLINESLSAQWQEQIEAIHEEGIDDELPDAIDINFDAIINPPKVSELAKEQAEDDANKVSDNQHNSDKHHGGSDVIYDSEYDEDIEEAEEKDSNVDNNKT